MTNISSLLAEASTARPIHKSRTTGKWAPLYPVFKALRERRFSGKAAVAWLIEKGQINLEEADRAENAFHQMAHTERKKEKQLS